MRSQVVIGCQSCLKEVLIDGSSIINESITPAFPVETAYSYENMDELFLNNYICLFCNETLTFTPSMMEFVSDFIDAKYHVSFTQSFVQITNNVETTTFPKQMTEDDVNIIKEVFEEKSLQENFPNPEEMKVLLKVAKGIDTTKWILKLESKYVGVPIPHVKPEGFQ